MFCHSPAGLWLRLSADGRDGRSEGVKGEEKLGCKGVRGAGGIKGWGVFDKEEIFDYNHHGVLQCV